MATKRPTIAVICFSHYFGGMEMDSYRYAKLLSRGYNIVLIVKKNSFISKNYKESARKYNIKIKEIPFFLNFSFSIITRTRHILKKYKISNVIFFGASELRSLYFAFHKLNINLIIRHGTTKTRSKKDALHKLIYSNVNWHIPICKHIAENVMKIIPFGKNTQMKVVYPSLRRPLPSRLNHISSDNREIRIIHIARITGGKGQLDAIEACNTLYENSIDFSLTLYGEVDPDFKLRLENKINSTPYRDRITLPGYVEDVEKCYLNADIFLFPSKGEGLSSSFIEALSYGLICIAYNNTSFPELQNMGFRFYLANDQDIGDLKRILLIAASSDEILNLPLNNNFELSKKLFNDEREFDELSELFI